MTSARMVICEQYKDLNSGIRVAEKSGKMMIRTCENRAKKETMKILKSGFTRAKESGMIICSCLMRMGVARMQMTTTLNHSWRFCRMGWRMEQPRNERRRTCIIWRFFWFESYSSKHWKYQHHSKKGNGVGDVWQFDTFVNDTLAKDLQWHVSKSYTTTIRLLFLQSNNLQK